MAAAGGPFRSSLPGLGLLAAVAVLASGVGGAVPFVDALMLAVGVGVVGGNLYEVPATFRPGIDQHKLLLEVGIVLLGASIPVGRVADSGVVVVALALGTVVFGVALVEVVSRVGFSLPARTRSLLAAGASVCGVSAVVAVASSIDADEETLAYVAGAVLLFDAVTLVVVPAAGAALGLPDRVFGVWAGLAMFSTGPVAAAGFSYSAVAGRWATLTKLVRNAFIGVLAVGYAVAYVRHGDGPGTSPGPGVVWTRFPKFLVGFLVVAAVANAGVLSASTVATVQSLSDWLFLLAFAGVGFSIKFDEMRSTGLAPVAVLVCYLLVVSTVTLVAVLAVL